MKLLVRVGVFIAALAVGTAVLGQPRAGATAANSSTEVSQHQDAAQAPLATATPAPTPMPSASPRVIYKGLTIEEIAADPKLLEEILSKGDYISAGGVRIAEDGTVDPPVSDGSTDTICPNGEECP
jgi:hypothetical protein